MTSPACQRCRMCRPAQQRHLLLVHRRGRRGELVVAFAGDHPHAPDVGEPALQQRRAGDLGAGQGGRGDRRLSQRDVAEPQERRRVPGAEDVHVDRDVEHHVAGLFVGRHDGRGQPQVVRPGRGLPDRALRPDEHDGEPRYDQRGYRGRQPGQAGPGEPLARCEPDQPDEARADQDGQRGQAELDVPLHVDRLDERPADQQEGRHDQPRQRYRRGVERAPVVREAGGRDTGQREQGEREHQSLEPAKSDTSLSIVLKSGRVTQAICFCSRCATSSSGPSTITAAAEAASQRSGIRPIRRPGPARPRAARRERRSAAASGRARPGSAARTG